MKSSRDYTIFIDLSFLSPDEEEVIQKVLLRDENLKKREVGRVRNLKDSVPDPKQLKVLSGEWFEDLKSKRYGRQPQVSAVVRSSMRWKKSAGPKTNPYQKAAPDTEDGEKNKPRPELSSDPRSIHPALSVQVLQENKDEAIVLEESPEAKLNTPILQVIEGGCQQGGKLQEQTACVEPLKLDIMTKEISTKTLDTESTTLKEDREVETRLETRLQQGDGNMPRNFEIRSFSKALETWEKFQLASDEESNKPQSMDKDVVISSKEGTETQKKEEIQAPIPKKRSGEAIRIVNITNKQTTPTSTEELNVDLKVKEDPGILEDLQTSHFNNMNTPMCLHLDQKRFDPEHKGKGRAIEEIVVTNIKYKTARAEELSVDLDAKRNPDILKSPAYNVNSTVFVNQYHKNLDPVQKGIGRADEEIIVADFKERSPPKIEELSVDLDVKRHPDIHDIPVNNVNTPVFVNLDHESLGPEHNETERTVEEIIVADFKERSPPKVEELSFDLDERTDPNILVGPVYNVSTPQCKNLDESLDSVLKQKERAIEEIIVADVTLRSPTRTDELCVDLAVEKDPNVFECPVSNEFTPVYVNLDQNSLGPVETGKGGPEEEIIVTDFKERSPPKIEELSVDLDVKRHPDILDIPVNNVNTPVFVNLDHNSLEPVHSGMERAFEEIIVADFKERSPPKIEELCIELDERRNPDILSGPVNNVNTSKCTSLVPSLDSMQKQKERAVEEITVADFKQRSTTKMEAISVDLNIEAKPDIVEDLKTGPVHKDVQKNENRLAVVYGDELPELVVKNKENESAGGKCDVDLDLWKEESINQKVSKEIEEIGEPEQEGSFQDESGISESSILASVYARATRPKSGMSITTSTPEPMQKTVDMIPAIVIMPSESNEQNEMERMKNETPAPEAFVEVAKPGTVTWEDEGVNSDDSSSVSSHDMDLTWKKDEFSASTLSVTERTASLMSVYSDAGDFGNVAVQGSVEFAIMYSPLGELVIMVEQCQDLAIANPRKQRTDPYVKTYLYPDKRSKRKTSIKKHTVNPVYVESLRYKVKREELPGRTLNLSVWHNDSRGRNAFLGQVEINLRYWDWKHQALTWYKLQPKNEDNQESQEYHGVLFVSLKYICPEATDGSQVNQPTGEIHVWLREARRLRRLKSHGIDSFVKCYMLPDTSKKSRQKTRVVKKTQDPVYNHNMVYDGFRAGEVGEACCELTVWDNNKLYNQFLGGVRLSLGTGQSYGKKVDWMDSENEEVEVWKKMIANPNSWVEAELPLRSSMTPRK